MSQEPTVSIRTESALEECACDIEGLASLVSRNDGVWRDVMTLYIDLQQINQRPRKCNSSLGRHTQTNGVVEPFFWNSAVAACDSAVHCAYVRGTLIVEPERTRVGTGTATSLGRGGDVGIFAKGEPLRSV